MYIWPAVTFFALIPCVLSSHFRGGLLTWKAVNESQILVSHRVSNVFSYCSTPETNTLECFNGCTGSVVMHANCTESNSIDNWADFFGETIFDIKNSTSSPIDLRFASIGDWMALTQPISATSWSLKMTVDLSLRNDTGNINQSPVSSMASSVTNPCTHDSVIIPVADFDGDDVRCRFASGSDECASVCSNHSSYMILENTNCRLFFYNAVPSGNYAVALQIEDFTDSSSTVPLSSVPLQFIINVNSSVPCSTGSYFVSPTPSGGIVLQSPNGLLQFTARARIAYSHDMVTKFHVMSPLTFTMSAISQPVQYEFEVTISLESDDNNVFGTHVVCFSIEVSTRLSSQPRCITVNITDINDCMPEPCQNNGTCTDLVNDYHCDCVAGFNGTNCENNMDECTPQPCQNNGTCTDLINGYQCNCTDGFNGTNCENDINDCLPNPCQNNGTCTDLVNDYQCGCLPGFNGTNCENNMDECASQPCQNNGTCIDLINGYHCNCIDGFNGTICAMDIDDCYPETCQNNGTCTDLVNAYQCSCVAGFNGTNCENNMDECTSQLCQNNGTCIDLVNGYQCNCMDGFNGTDCEIDINDCQAEPCQNNGTCTDLVNDYQCDCVAGFNGANCDNNVDECASQPCQNNGTCIDLINGYQCDCTDGFNGTDCEFDVVLCAPSPCKNNGTCIELINRFQCQCPVEFNGTTCSTESYLTKFTMELKIDVTISEDLSSSTNYNTVKRKVHFALTELYSTIPGSTVIIQSLRKGSLIVDFDLIIPDDPVYKVQVVDTVYKLVNGLAFVNYSGEVVNVTSASFNSSAGTVIITNSTDGCSIMNSQSVCSPGYRCHEFNNYTVACIPIIISDKRATFGLYCKPGITKNNIYRNMLGWCSV